jgi:putative FmdB family regulatory protein
MPIYDYRCRRCGVTFEQLRRLQDADHDLRCPKCDSDEVERLLSTFAAGGCGTGSSPSRFR